MQLVDTVLKKTDLSEVHEEIAKITFNPDNQRDTDGRSLLHAACERGDVELVRKLVDRRANIEIKTAKVWRCACRQCFDSRPFTVSTVG
jgi:ankyrin repeat protein